MVKLLQIIRHDNGETFTDLHIDSIVLYKEEYYAKIYFVSPKVYGEQEKQLIHDSITRIFPEGYTFEIDFSKVYCDKDIAYNFLKQYFADNFPSLPASVLEVNAVNTEDVFNISLVLDGRAKEFSKAKSVKTNIEDALSEKFKQKFSVHIDYRDIQQTDDIPEQYGGYCVLSADNDESQAMRRIIEIGDKSLLFGKDMGNSAYYIEDFQTNTGEEVVLCGKISYFTKRISKKDKAFYNFMLEDFTGKIPSVIFPSQANMPKAEKLTDGTEIIACGRVELDSYRGKNSFSIRHIALCQLPENFVKVEKQSLPAPEEYTYVFPQKIEIASQVDFFTGGVKEISKYFFNKTFVVFDIETTGFNYDLDKITEIGAIKIEDGIITSSFSTLINPEVEIKAETIKLNGIDNELVKDSPKINDIIPDFYKYVDGAMLVAHNLNFDLPFVKYNADKIGYYFNNEAFDTLTIARERLLGMSNYKLDTLCAHFNIDLTDHHRAWNDALATAKLYIELMNLPKPATK